MKVSRAWMKVNAGWLPFADAASADLPMARLLRLSLFQVSVGMVTVLLIGTLNRVMIVELFVPTWMVAVMVALPIVFAPFRALIGFRSDQHRSVLGWRRVPYIWMGSVYIFGGLAMMPFALILLSGDTTAPPVVGQIAAAVAFLCVGAGIHQVQTVGLALATDLAPVETQPRVVALLSVMQLLGMLVSAVLFGVLLQNFSQLRLIQVIQGTAVISIALTLYAIWKQEARNPAATRADRPQEDFRTAWADLKSQGPWLRRLSSVGLGTFAFAMQDVLLEPYGGQVLGLTVSQTTLLTAGFALGGIVGFLRAARAIERGSDPHRIGGYGAAWGTIAFAGVILAAPLQSGFLFACATTVIGFGAGLFAHATLTSCMRAAPPGKIGLALGAWGSVQATCAGGAIAFGGVLRDAAARLAETGALGPALTGSAAGYGIVYGLEIILLFIAIAVIGPLVRPLAAQPKTETMRLGLAGSSSSS